MSRLKKYSRRIGTALLQPWLLVPALVILCLQTAWLGMCVAQGALPQEADGAGTVTRVMPAGDGAVHMVSADCLSCHQVQPVFSHPVGMKPHAALPAEFPLEGGQMNCVTCHRDTISEHAAAGAATTEKSLTSTKMLLRGSQTGQAFCAQCHTQEDLTRQSQHPFAFSQAHLGAFKQTTASANPVDGRREDGVTSCLSCHDGTVARDAFAGLMASAPSFSSQGSLTGHPVGVAYPVGTLRRGDAVFHAAGAIDSRIRLTAGQVTCNSCHSLYSREPLLLVMRNDHSAMCMSCHAE